MPAVLRSLSRRLPALEVAMECARSAEPLAEQVKGGKLDLAFGYPPLPAGPFGFERLLDDPYVLVVPASWPIAGCERGVGLEELSGMPLIGTGDQSPSAEVAMRLEESRLEPEWAASAEGDGAAQALVAAGLGAAIVPRMSVDFREEQIAALDLDDVVPPRQIVLYWRTGGVNSAGLDAFVEAASQACGAGLNRLESTQVAQRAA
jgi:DNA-binding transcriptional LysR family regulator